MKLLIKIIIPISQMVKADIKHQKHQARMMRHCRYVKNKDSSDAAATASLKIKSQIANGPIPITKKAEMNEAMI